MDTVTGTASTPFSGEIFDNANAVVGPGDEFTGFQSVGTLGNILQYYGDLDADTITIGVRHIGTTGLIFAANPLTYGFGGLDWAGPGSITGFVLESAVAQVLFPDPSDPNARWVGWGQDTSTPPAWAPVWNVGTQSFSVVATEGFTISPGADVWATFRVVPEPGSLLLVGLGLLGVAARRRRG
jgi:hypothetical protein